MRELFERMNMGPEDGDHIGSCCINCGRNYPYPVGVDKDRSMGRCPICHSAFKAMWKTAVTGSLRVNNKEVRDTIAKAIEEHTAFSVFIEERVGNLWVYNPHGLASKVKEE